MIATRAGRAVMLAIGAIAATSCERPDRTEVGAPVVIVSIDTLRADHLPAYGYRGVSTPALDALRRDAILVEQAWTHVPLTLPAHASLFTGLLPTEHGVRDNSGYRLDDGTATLASLLHDKGYATGAAVSAYVLRGETGLRTGFDVYDDAIELGSGTGLAEQQRAGLDSLRASLPWLRRAAAGGPFFYWLHVYEPHTPYDPPEPHRSRYPSAYDGEVAAADAVIGELLRTLRELEAYERSLIVVVADHGEGLGDHGEEEHGILLYREVLQVPLLIKLPGNQRAGAAIDRPSQLIDVLPTVLDAVGLDSVEQGSGQAAPLHRHGHGRSLLAEPAPRAERDPPIYAETWYPRLHHGWSELRSAIASSFHFIEGPDPELYDLAADPAERRNLVADEPRAAAALASALASLEVAPSPPLEEDAETRRRLAALGYLSGTERGADASAAGRPRPDPKTQLESLRALEEARRRFAAGESDAAQRALERLVREQPEMVDAWETLGDLHESAGRFEAALAARRRAVETSGGAPEQALKVAPLLLQLGRAAEAKQHAILAVEAFPATAHTVLARIALASGDLDEAEREARAAVAARSGTTTPVLTLAEVLAAKGDDDGALAAIAGVEQELLARALPDPRPFLLRAEILARAQEESGEPGARAGSGDAERALDLAAREAERLLALHPESVVGRAALARLDELRHAAAPPVEELERAFAAGRLADALKPALALEWSRRGRTADATALVEELARRGDAAATHAWAVALTDGGDNAGARRVLEARLAQHPDDASAHETLGLVELRLGEPRAAAAHLERAVVLAPSGANAWNLLGVARWQGTRDGDGAIAAWERALALDPERWEALQNLGNVALETGRLARARDALARFVAEAPADRYAEDLAAARRTLVRLENEG